MSTIIAEQEVTGIIAEPEGEGLPQKESLQIQGIDYIEFYVGNATQATHFYRNTFGLTPTAYSGLETGAHEDVSYVVEQRKVRLIFTSALNPESPVAAHVNQHGDGVKDIAFKVKDAKQAFEYAVRRGAQPVMEPTVFENDNGYVIKATIASFGDTVHSFIERNNFRGTFLPAFMDINDLLPIPATHLAAIDHLAISVEQGTLDRWTDFYKEALGFRQTDERDILTENSALNSKVVQNSTGLIKLVFMEPAPGKHKSQIEEYLDFYRGSGTQHVAMLSANIFKSVAALRATGIKFLHAPDSYYEMLEDRIGKIDEDMKALRELHILVDRDEWGYLMQVFTKPVQSRPTVFMEIIQRVGARGFGGGNVLALFKAMEREQALRGNL
jgi:4-hydroxyphenylpyruvate dioxygenase